LKADDARIAAEIMQARQPTQLAQYYYPNYYYHHHHHHHHHHGYFIPLPPRYYRHHHNHYHPHDHSQVGFGVYNR